MRDLPIETPSGCSPSRSDVSSVRLCADYVRRSGGGSIAPVRLTINPYDRAGTKRLAPLDNVLQAMLERRRFSPAAAC